MSDRKDSPIPRFRILLAICLSYMLFAVLLNSVGTVILQSIASLGQTKTSASVLEAFKDLPIAITSFLVASLLPRFGLKNSLALACVLVGIACIAMPLVPAFATAKLLFAVTGMSFALVKVSCFALLGLVSRNAKDHASLMNFLEGLFMVGVLSGYVVFSAFIDSSDPAGVGWVQVYWPLAVVSFVICALVITTPIDETAARPAAFDTRRDMLAMFTLCAKPLVLVFLVSAFLYVLIEQAIGTWLPTFNNEVLGMPHAMSVLATSLFALSTAIGRLGAGLVLRSVGWFTLLATCIAAMSLLIVLTLPLTTGLEPRPGMTWGTAPVAVYILPAIGLFLAPIYPIINSRILSALPTPTHAPMTGLIVVFSALGGTTGSFITGQLFSALGGQMAFYAALVPIALLMITLLIFRQVSVRSIATS